MKSYKPKSIWPLAVEVDASALTEVMSSLVDALNGAPNGVKFLVDRLLGGGELFAIHSDSCAAAGAGNFRVVLQASPFLLNLVAALRAMKRENLIIKYHKSCRGKRPLGLTRVLTSPHEKQTKTRV